MKAANQKATVDRWHMSLTRVDCIEDTRSWCCGVLVCKTRADYAEEEETNIQN
jgi:hypothetical protein